MNSKIKGVVVALGVLALADCGGMTHRDTDTVVGGCGRRGRRGNHRRCRRCSRRGCRRRCDRQPGRQALIRAARI